MFSNKKVCAFGFVAALLACAIPVDRSFADQMCTNNNGTTPWVCLTKTGPAPVENTDFAFDLAVLTKPGITLFTGNSGWIISSQVSESDPTLADLGDILIAADVTTAEFALSIAVGTGPGAANVGSILLDDTNPLWTGGSSISGGSITGNLDGDLKVIFSGEGYGNVDFIIEGNAEGNIEIHEVRVTDSFHIKGHLNGFMDVGTVKGDLEVFGNINDNVTIDLISGGDVDLGGDVSAGVTVTVGDMETNGGSAIFEIGHYTDTFDLRGRIVLLNGVPAGQIAKVFDDAPASNTGQVDLNGMDIAGFLQIAHPGYVDLINTGTVKSGGELLIGHGSGPADMFGVMTIAGVEGGPNAGELNFVRTKISDGATFHVTGDVDGSVEFSSAASMESGGEFILDGAMDGTSTFLRVGGTLSFGSVGGSVHIDTKMEGGQLTVNGDVGAGATSYDYVGSARTARPSGNSGSYRRVCG